VQGRRRVNVHLRGAACVEQVVRVRRWVLLFALSLLMQTACAASTVYVDRIGGFDADLVNLARPALTAWIETSGSRPTGQRDTADYSIRFAVSDASAERPFNWWILFVPVWPFVPVTTVEASVVLTVAIFSRAGLEVFTNTAGAEVSQWLFADFYSRHWAKEKAFGVAFRRVMVSAFLP
jgi:hypothetical protein